MILLACTVSQAGRGEDTHEEVLSSCQTVRHGSSHAAANRGLVVVFGLGSRINAAEPILNGLVHKVRRAVFLPGGTVHEFGDLGYCWRRSQGQVSSQCRSLGPNARLCHRHWMLWTNKLYQKPNRLVVAHVAGQGLARSKPNRGWDRVGCRYGNPLTNNLTPVLVWLRVRCRG